MHDHIPRFNLYALIHKGLRAALAQALLAAGRTDWEDGAESARTLGEVRALLDFCESHLRHENDFIHPAMESRQPGSSERVAGDHLGHLQTIAALREQLRAQEAFRGAARQRAGEILYHNLVRFAAENFEHMHHEETHNNAALWAAYSDEEIHRIHRALVSSLSPRESLLSMRWMLPNASHGERVQVLCEVRAHAPAAVFEGLLGMLHAQLAGRDWRKLNQALGLNEAVAA